MDRRGQVLSGDCGFEGPGHGGSYGGGLVCDHKIAMPSEEQSCYTSSPSLLHAGGTMHHAVMPRPELQAQQNLLNHKLQRYPQQQQQLRLLRPGPHGVPVEFSLARKRGITPTQLLVSKHTCEHLGP